MTEHHRLGRHERERALGAELRARRLGRRRRLWDAIAVEIGWPELLAELGLERRPAPATSAAPRGGLVEVAVAPAAPQLDRAE